MDNLAEKTIWGLRSRYPHLTFSRFARLLSDLGVDDVSSMEKRRLADLCSILAEEDREAQAEYQRGEQAISRCGEMIAANVREMHRALDVVAPPGIDLEHVQAVLVHGFAAPGRSALYVKKSYLPERHVREDVENKLGEKFSSEAYRAALNFLLANGAIIQPKKRHGTMLVSYNPREKDLSVTPIGRRIIRAMNAFMHAVHRHHGAARN